MKADLGYHAISQHPQRTRLAHSLSQYLAQRHRGKARFGRVELGRSYCNVSGSVFNPAMPDDGAPRRGKIKHLSERSRRRLGEVIGEACHLWAPAGHGVTMITLTYHHAPRDMHVVKADFNRFMVAWRRRFKSPSYVAWLEFQKRNDAHFHMIVPGCVGAGLVTELWGQASGQLGDDDFLDHGCTANFKQGDADFVAHLAATYARKYGAKLDQKIVPECYRAWVGRFWFASRDIRQNVLVFMVDYAVIRFWKRIAKRSKSWIGPDLVVRKSSVTANFLLTLEKHGYTVAQAMKGVPLADQWEAAKGGCGP